MENDINQVLKEAIERLNQELEDNRIEFEALKKEQEDNKEAIEFVSKIIDKVNNNKENRNRIESLLDKYYFQVQQANLS
jgi:DNA repair exonuclease SbcCD ATPase subunit